jgi:HlyD family secretion protein
MRDPTPLPDSRAVACALLLAAAGLAGCSKGDATAATPARAVLTVELATPSQESWPQRVGASGTVAAWQEASIGAELGGVRLDEVRVNVGDMVAQGQLLARFNEDSLRAELARLDAGVAEAQAALDKARLDAQGADRLEASGALSAQEIRGVRAQAAIAEARLASARAARDAQALRLAQARVTAPDDGVISSRSATVGSVVNPGAELFRLIRRGRLEWRAEVRADALPRLKPGTRATLLRPDGERLAGAVRQVAPAVDRSTLNCIVYVDLPAGTGLAAGMFLSGEFELAASPVLALPESALVLRNGNTYLMRVDDTGRVQEVKVTTGRRQGSDVEITAGAEPAARYARSGGAFLNDGDRVAIAGEPAAAP